MGDSKNKTESMLPALNSEKKKPLTGVKHVEKHKTNPFMQETRIEVKGKKRFYSVGVRGDIVTNQRTGEVTGFVEHKYVRLVDDSQFVKVFAAGAAALYQLSRSGTAVMRYLLQVVQDYPGTDRIYLSFMDAAEEPFAIPKATFYRGLAELIDRQFVAPSTSPNLFFLNPMMVFNGDRFRFVQEFVKESKATDDDRLLASNVPSLEQNHIAGMIEKPRRKKALTDAQQRKELEHAGQQRIIE